MQTIVVISLLFAAYNAATLSEIPVKTLGTADYYLKTAYCDISNDEFRMSGRCYCFSTDNSQWECSSPGPTLKMIAGTNPTLHFFNDFTNSVVDEPNCHNKYCDLDVTNLHTHGLHVDVKWDNVLEDIYPQNGYDYHYEIPSDHYPGIHWYHPHNHGSVSHQIHFGLFGALYTEYPNSDNYPDKRLFTGSLSESAPTDGYKTTLLVFSNVYATNSASCNCDDLDDISETVILTAGKVGNMAYGRYAEHGKLSFHIYSTCYEWCSFRGSRASSGLAYDVEITGSDESAVQYFVVNGQINPTIEAITVNRYRRLQLLNTVSQYYLHYKFPSVCDFYLLGYDGVFFDDGERNLNEYENELILAPGSRADILFKCNSIGLHQIYTISDDETAQSETVDADLNSLERAGSDERKNLFLINVVSSGEDTASDLPSGYPAKPNYLKDLRNVDAVDGNCACNQYGATTACAADECCIHYNSKEGFLVNTEEFSSATRYFTYMIQDGIYEWKLRTDRHVHHQHIYPFQLQNDVASGFIAKRGDWMDTFGAENEHMMRMHTADFSGYMVFHCHILPHEDEGMMGISYVISADVVSGYEGTNDSPLTDQCRTQLQNDFVSGSLPSTPSTPSTPTLSSSPIQPTPSPVTPPVDGGGGGKGEKPNRSSVFTVQWNELDKHDALIFIVSFFVILSLCNTVILCKTHLFNDRRTMYRQFEIRGKKKKYAFIEAVDTDDQTDDEQNEMNQNL